MHKLRKRHMALVLGVAAIAAAGCGSSSSSKSSAQAPAPSTPATPSTPSTGTSTTPASGFSAQLNTLCKTANTQAQAAGTDLQKVAAIAEQTLPKLEALMPPPAEKAAYDQFVANTKAQITAAKKNDAAEVKKLSANDAALAKKLGAPDCG